MAIFSLSLNSDSYPKPNISLSPSKRIAPGMDISLICRGSRQGVRFKLYRARVALRHTEPPGMMAEFHITNARREDGGIYACQYESLTEPPVISPLSDPVELVVAGEGTELVVAGVGSTEGSGSKGCPAGIVPSHRNPSLSL
uniref:Ig-like domain-containing protein n=1 Tax=Pelusios castaneus TaxID=367368 RepID=A0A8C8SQJ4_9SAUR